MDTLQVPGTTGKPSQTQEGSSGAISPDTLSFFKDKVKSRRDQLARHSHLPPPSAAQLKKTAEAATAAANALGSVHNYNDVTSDISEVPLWNFSQWLNTTKAVGTTTC